MQQDKITTNQLRSFGLTVGGIFALIGLWPAVFHNNDPRWWAVVLAGFLVVPALVFPRSLSWVYKRWMALGHIMSFTSSLRPSELSGVCLVGTRWAKKSEPT
jgi:cell division protein FtsW (lipid II flippase)